MRENIRGGLREPPTSLETAPERIADQIRASIVDGGLPAGTQLTEIQIAERLGVSRGPIREAMQRLIQRRAPPR